jgi:GTP-binding protein
MIAALAPFRVADAAFEASATSLASLPAPAALEACFAGRSNVGKSSLMNALVSRKGLVRTSSTPGCTRALNLFSVTLAGGPSLSMVDLPGYGYAKLSKAEKGRWGAMIEAYLRERPSLRAVVVIVDVRRGLEDDDKELMTFVQACNAQDKTRSLAVIFVATKLDKLALSKRKPALAALKRNAGLSPVGFSAETGQGREELWARLLSAVG